MKTNTNSRKSDNIFILHQLNISCSQQISSNTTLQIVYAFSAVLQKKSECYVIAHVLSCVTKTLHSSNSNRFS